MEQRVLVCGGRHYRNRRLVYAVLDAAHAANPIVCLVHGGATGADTLAADWARGEGVPAQKFLPDWKAHSRGAGPIRNKEMLDKGRPHLVIAFKGGAGTKNMIDQAEKANVPVARVRDVALERC